MHPCPGNWVAIKRAVVCYAQAVHTFSAGIKSRRCRRKDGSHPTKTRKSTNNLLELSLDTLVVENGNRMHGSIWIQQGCLLEHRGSSKG